MSEYIPDIFISYSSKDRAWVSGLATALEACGLSVWWDRELLAGDNYHKSIEQALNKARCVVTVWSENSVESEWVVAESDRGKARGVLVPLIYRPTNIPLAFATKHNVDLQQWLGHVDETAFQLLLRAIEAVLQRPEQSIGSVAGQSFLPKDLKQPSGQLLESGNHRVYWVIAVVVCALVVIGFLQGRQVPDSGGGISAGGNVTIGNGNVINPGDGKVVVNESK